MKRREFLIQSSTVLAAAPFLNLAKAEANRRKMLIMGIDGMDPGIVKRLMNSGRMPNLQALARSGTFNMMRSTVPPQSPVAWGSFISGADPGMYGIFDFVHRDPRTYFPKFSESETIPAGHFFKLGRYRIPLHPGKVVLKREGRAFWDELENGDIEATIIKVPTNFPPSSSHQRTLSGMGVPDLMGGYGIYTLFTSDEQEAQKDLSPHNVYYAYIDENNVMEGQISGPTNDLVQDSENLVIPFKVYVDNHRRTVRIDIQGQEFLLAEGQYSDWVEINFALIPYVQSLRGIVKFYLMEMGRRFRLYVTPIQIDPAHPALPICTPDSYSRELVSKIGFFHTLGLPADFNAIKTGTFGMEHYVVQLRSIFSESQKLYEHELQRFCTRKQGLLFFYFSTLDQGQHIFWALNDPSHPFFHPEESKTFAGITDELYCQFDAIVGRTQRAIGNDVSLLVISDHGFAPFRREVNLNTWLLQNSYIKLKTGEAAEGAVLFQSADWGQTRVYGMGLNGLYLNLQGREGEGIVPAQERRPLLEELKARIEQIVDAKTGEKVVSTAYIAEDCYSAKYRDRAPDIILGFNRGYRSGDGFGEGRLSHNVVGDNLNWWSGDHCIDPKHVPASFLANFPIGKQVPELRDLAPTILNFFGINKPKYMNGNSLL